MSSRKREIESPEDCRRVVTLRYVFCSFYLVSFFLSLLLFSYKPYVLRFTNLICILGTENFQFKRDLVIPMQVYLHTLQTTDAANHCKSFCRMHDLARTLAHAEYACGSMPVWE